MDRKRHLGLSVIALLMSSCATAGATPDQVERLRIAQKQGPDIGIFSYGTAEWSEFLKSGKATAQERSVWRALSVRSLKAQAGTAYIAHIGTRPVTLVAATFFIGHIKYGDNCRVVAWGRFAGRVADEAMAADLNGQIDMGVSAVKWAPAPDRGWTEGNFVVCTIGKFADIHGAAYKSPGVFDYNHLPSSLITTIEVPADLPPSPVPLSEVHFTSVGALQ